MCVTCHDRGATIVWCGLLTCVETVEVRDTELSGYPCQRLQGGGMWACRLGQLS